MIVAMCVDTCSMQVCYVILRNCTGCMNVAWALFWGGSRSTKPSVFLCKVAAAGHARYLVCAAVAAAVVHARIVSSSVFCNEWLFLCVSSIRFLESLVADRIGMAA